MSWKQTINPETKAETLSKDFKFKSFLEAWAFMSQVALLAEKLEHHPDWSNSYSKVSISLSTHSAGDKVTEKDRKLAQQIDELRN